MDNATIVGTRLTFVSVPQCASITKMVWSTPLIQADLATGTRKQSSHYIWMLQRVDRMVPLKEPWPSYGYQGWTDPISWIQCWSRFQGPRAGSGMSSDRHVWRKEDHSARHPWCPYASYGSRKPSSGNMHGSKGIHGYLDPQYPSNGSH